MTRRTRPSTRGRRALRVMADPPLKSLHFTGMLPMLNPAERYAVGRITGASCYFLNGSYTCTGLPKLSPAVLAAELGQTEGNMRRTFRLLAEAGLLYRADRKLWLPSFPREVLAGTLMHAGRTVEEAEAEASAFLGNTRDFTGPVKSLHFANPLSKLGTPSEVYAYGRICGECLYVGRDGKYAGEGWCTLGARELSRESGVSAFSFWRALASLEEKGLAWRCPRGKSRGHTFLMRPERHFANTLQRFGMRLDSETGNIMDTATDEIIDNIINRRTK